jgi:hypothetical protein
VQALGFTVPEEYAGGWVDQVAGMPLVKFRLYLHGRGVDIDAFLAETRFQQQILSRRQRVALDNLEVWLVSPEDLILLKLLAGVLAILPILETSFSPRDNSTRRISDVARNHSACLTPWSDCSPSHLVSDCIHHNAGDEVRAGA